MKFLSIFILFNLLFSSFLFSQSPAQVVPKFTLYQLNQTSFTNENVAKNKPLFFFFFDPDCDHCQQTAINLNKQFKGFTKAAVYLVSQANDNKINAFMDKYLPIFRNGKNVTILRDKNNEFVTKFLPNRYPAMYVFDTNQKLVDYEDNPETIFRIVKALQTAVK